MTSLEKILKTYWQFDSFRPLQKEIIESVLKGNDTLALLPTGGGKSVCYQLPSLINKGCTLVISPLVALMQDQVNRLKELDISSAFIHGGMHYKAVENILENAINDAYQLLYISPERIQNKLFQEYVHSLNIDLIAIDEAHCISQWGHDFRPDYLKIVALRTLFPNAPVLALTATATEEVQQDIVQQLALKTPNIFKQSFKRDNIFYEVKNTENKISDTINAIRQHQESVIIYCRSRRQTEQLTKSLNEFDIKAIAYHAGMSKEKRDLAQKMWMQNEVKTIIATTAFGMGIDKPDVRLVLHYDAPEHLEAYYQEAGRAGRDRKKSFALALFNAGDIKRLHESVLIQFPPEKYLRQVYQSVCEYLQIPIGNAPEQYYPFELQDFCKKFQLQALQATHALKLLEREGLWSISDAVYHPATVQFITEKETLDHLATYNPNAAFVCTSLLRLYGSVFYYPTSIRINAIAKQAKMKQDEVQHHLSWLHQHGIIDYQQPKNGAHLYFNHQRVDSKHLLIDLQRIHRLREKHIIRTNVMIQFLHEQTNCRERMILNYFGENSNDDCGHCDNCFNKKHSVDKSEIEQTLFQLLSSNKPLSIDNIKQHFPDNAHQQLIAVIRKNMDQEKIFRNEDGNFYTP